MSGIYIHIPFCKQACHYCNFHFSTNQKEVDQLEEGMLKELDLRLTELKTPLESIYFGGGSPSLLSADKLSNLIHQSKAKFSFHDGIEITLEVNPDDVSKSYLKDVKEAGVNRLSLGVQSFYEKDLKLMNRAHSVDQALQSMEWVSSVFSNFSVDLIYGMPNSTLKEWETNLNQALKFNPPHISTYALTVEEKTALASFINNGKQKPLVEEKTAYQFEILQSVMADNQFIHYEISNFCKEGHYAKHNTAYWKGHSYLGVGPSAHSFNQSTREWNIANNHQYIDQIRREIIPSTIEILSLENRMNEYLMLSLRTIWGADLNYFEDAFGSANKNILLHIN